MWGLKGTAQQHGSWQGHCHEAMTGSSHCLLSLLATPRIYKVLSKCSALEFRTDL